MLIRAGSACPAVALLNMRQTAGPSMYWPPMPKPTMRRVNTSMTTSTQWLCSNIDSQRNRSTLLKAILGLCDEGEPGRTRDIRMTRDVVVCQDFAYDVLINLHRESM